MNNINQNRPEYLAAGADAQSLGSLRGRVSVLLRDRAAVPPAGPSLGVAVPGGSPRHRDPLSDVLFPALEPVFFQKFCCLVVVDDQLQMLTRFSGSDPAHHLLVILALHILSVNEGQPVTGPEPGLGGRGVGLHQADELAAPSLLSVQVKPVPVRGFLHQTPPGSEARHPGGFGLI